MRTSRRVRQSMYYCLPLGEKPVYERDEDGNIIYRISGGEKIPIETGEKRQEYTEPLMFFNSITDTLTEDEFLAFGAKDRGNAKMTYKRNEYPFVPGTLVWKNSELKYLGDGTVDPDSADYIVVGVLTSGQHFWRCILSAVVKSHADND